MHVCVCVVCCLSLLERIGEFERKHLGIIRCGYHTHTAHKYTSRERRMRKDLFGVGAGERARRWGMFGTRRYRKISGEGVRACVKPNPS